MGNSDKPQLTDLFIRLMDTANWGLHPGSIDVPKSLLIEAAKEIERLRDQLFISEQSVRYRDD